MVFIYGLKVDEGADTDLVFSLACEECLMSQNTR